MEIENDDESVLVDLPRAISVRGQSECIVSRSV